MSEIVYLGDTISRIGGKAGTRKAQDIAAIAVHRFGGWEDDRFQYPPTKDEAARVRLPWNPDLVGSCWDDSPIGVACFYSDIFGWRHPYPLQVFDGKAFQTSPFDVVTYHAGDFNHQVLGFLITGDHRKTAPSEVDLEVAALAIARICLYRRWHPWGAVTMPGAIRSNLTRVMGHDELPAGGTATPGKSCPGAALDMNAFRDRIAAHLLRLREDSLSGAGFVLTS